MRERLVKPTIDEPRQQLTLLDSTCIIVGIIIGSAIYEISPTIAQNVSQFALETAERLAGRGPDYFSPASQWWIAVAAIVGVWLVGGLVAGIGALCYAELATAYPRDGGNYVFLSRAFGREAGFAFAWIEFWIIRPGNLGAVAFVFARYAGKLLPGGLSQVGQTGLAIAAILLLTFVNLANVRIGTATQNLLTLAKVLGLALIVGVAFWMGLPASVAADVAPRSEGGGNLALAFLFVMFAYGGWSDVSYVAAEVRDPRRNIARALVIGTLAVAVLYVAINLAFLTGLGLRGFLDSQAVASDVLARAWGATGSRLISVLICVSCLGAMNGMIFTGSRIYYALGTEHRLFAWLGKWNAARDVPLRSLLLQAAVTVLLLAAFGAYPRGFERLVVFTGPFFWGFFMLVGLALFVLRHWDASRPRPFRVPLYPLTPLVFVVTSGWMTASVVIYMQSNLSWEGIWALVVVAAGLVVERWDRRRQQAAASEYGHRLTDSNIHA